MSSSVAPNFPPFGFGGGSNGGTVVVPPTQSGSYAPPVAGRSLQIPLPEVLPIPDAHEFNPVGSLATAAISGPTDIPGTILAIPQGNIGVIRGVTLYISNMLTTTNVVWSLFVNGLIPAGYSNLSIFPRSAPFVSNGFDSMIRFDAEANIKIVFSNLDGGTYVVGASYSGWFWPKASDDRWKMFGPL